MFLVRSITLQTLYCSTFYCFTPRFYSCRASEMDRLRELVRMWNNSSDLFEQCNKGKEDKCSGNQFSFDSLRTPMEGEEIQWNHPLVSLNPEGNITWRLRSRHCQGWRSESDLSTRVKKSRWATLQTFDAEEAKPAMIDLSWMAAPIMMWNFLWK